MRLGLVGASTGDLGALARALRTAAQSAQRVVYLAHDDAFDAVMEGWVELLGAGPSLRRRAQEVLDEDPDAITRAIVTEGARRSLSRITRLAGPGCRSVEILLDRVVLLADDKTDLDEEDLLPASVIAFGRGEALIRRVGTRIFVAPGPPSAEAGIALLDVGETSPLLTVTLLDADGHEHQREVTELGRAAAKLRVQGATG